MTRLTALAAATLAVVCTAAAADPGYYVVTAYSDPGVRTIDFRYWDVKYPGSPVVIWPEVGLGLNVNARWHTEIRASWVGSTGYATKLSTLTWQNDVLLTQGQYDLDVAIHTMFVKPADPSIGNAFEFGPVFQTDIGRTQANFNLVFERGYGAQSSNPTGLKYQWQLRHRWKPWLHFGVQGFGELGPWDDWAPHGQQSHRGGPALFGKLPIGEQSLAWQAAYLIGKTYGQHGRMFTMQVKYNF